MGELYPYLRRLAQALTEQETLSTTTLGDLWGASQQTASRKIRDLVSAGLIERSLVPEGQKLALSEKGRALLLEEYGHLSRLLSQKPKSITGTLISGLGEGAYYVRKYRSRITDKIGFTPYLGTLNLTVDPAERATFLSSLEKLTIPEFKSKERTYGAVHCFPVLIGGRFRGAVLVPLRTTHNLDVLELIAPEFLRENLKLKDGDTVEVTP